MNIPEGFVLVPVDSIKAIDMGWAYLDAAREAEPNKIHSFSHAGYRAMDAAAPPVEIPAYDEAKERQLFEDSMLLASEEAGYGEPDLYLLPDGSYRQEFHQAAWGGWKACAQSRDGSVSDE